MRHLKAKAQECWFKEQPDIMMDGLLGVNGLNEFCVLPLLSSPPSLCLPLSSWWFYLPSPGQPTSPQHQEGENNGAEYSSGSLSWLSLRNDGTPPSPMKVRWGKKAPA
uniref:Uncharacterized protein n=1 Tax=Kangiella spongicola TaxID=796379 RepID=A0A318D8E5_9GAMM